MSPSPNLVSVASEPYRAAGRLAYHFARGKLTHDPMFEAILSRGLLARRSKILDLGCGQGLLAAWLAAARSQPASSWPTHWPAAPQPAEFRGVDFVKRYVVRARVALGDAASFVEGDVRTVDFGTADGIVILDVLHYIAYADQQRILERAHAALNGDGILLLRIGDAAGGFKFKMGTWVDRMALLGGGRILQRLHCRSTHEWQNLLSRIGFDSEFIPMSDGTPFANVLLMAQPR